MPQAHTIGNHFWHRIRLQKDAPRHFTFDTMETEHPFRWANPAHIFRIVGRFGIVVGRWRESAWSEEEHLFIATQGHSERGDIVGEGGTTIEQQRELTYANTLPHLDEIRAREAAASPLNFFNGWVVK